MTAMFFEATLLERTYLSPGMVRLRFGGDGLRHFAGTGVADEYLRLFFPNPDTGRVHLPHIDADGRWTYPDGRDTIRCSTYTVRRLDAANQQLDIDFVVHEGGTASNWAQGAPVGSIITINRPRGLYTPPEDMRWQFLLADATGLPAVARILEQTPPDVQSRVFIEVAAPEHQLVLPTHPRATVTWLHSSGNGIAPSRLGEVVHAIRLPTEPGYIWVAGEQRAVRGIRRHLRHTLGLKPDQYELVGYWTADDQWEAKWAALPEDIKVAIDAGWDSGRDPEVLIDEYDATLDKYGL